MEAVALFTGGFAAGLVAGTASCAAVQGGLLAGLASGAPRGPSGAAREHRPSSGRGSVLLFLAGRLASHTAAGALLGLLGSAVRPSPAARAALLVATGIAVACFGIRMLVRRPAACSGDAPPGAAAPPDAGRALLLGAATVLVPCGVTLGVEAAAVSTGSVAGGAAALAGFAVGSSPAFALLGLVLRRVATGRPAAVAGVAVLVAGVWTAGSGLRLGGWTPAPGGAAAAAPAVPSAGAGGVQRIEVWATGRGYRPGVVTARAGVPVELVFRLSGAPGCTRTLTVDGRDVVLPAVVRLAPHGPGTLRYVCSMGMYVGFVNFVG
ncbi:sulfite exporter TauE/SafE family protein [Planomonospora alba]|uniref:urease accessory protein UreH domain-containing protein n=1 Tax=Planomonospora alba TaxID=161354 RepID=UPI0031EB564B